MRMTRAVKKILANYESDSPGAKANLARILMQGKLGGTGKLIILPVDQGFEHGPARSFAVNPPAYDPHYHYQMAVDAGLSAYAAPLGPLEAGADTFAGQIPTILKVNSSNSRATSIDQAVYGERRRCAAPRLRGDRLHHLPRLGSDHFEHDGRDSRAVPKRRRPSASRPCFWSYPRGGKLSKDGETGARRTEPMPPIMAALLGAHIIKVKPAVRAYRAGGSQGPKAYEGFRLLEPGGSRPPRRPGELRRSPHRRLLGRCGQGRRCGLSGRNSRDSLAAGGSNGSIIGRNSFQREKGDAMELLNTIVDIYRGKA